MISKTDLDELKSILADDYGSVLSDDEAAEVGETWVGLYDSLFGERWNTYEV